MINLKDGRKGFENFGNAYAPAGNVTRKDITVAGVPCAWFTPADAGEDDIVIYIHGGAFIFGSINSHAPMVSHIAAAANRKILAIDYRLAPEHPFPAGVEDCVAVITAIREQYPQVNFGLMGDSAGGNVTMATLLSLKALNGPLPLYSIVISPWVDLECKNASYERNKTVDTLLGRAYLMEAAGMYAAGRELTTPLLSPVNADFTGCPPVLVMCGTYEILEDDSVHLHKRLQECGVDATLELFEGELHVWPFNEIDTKASQQALRDMAHFVAKHSTVKI
ncbi:alpha/beta hydrolase [Chitinophaga agrisoli]|uniref:Alpha/beta hydrolase n=1 Tax=Chitinophaga agrisoli TaxID=2607653 RepID=A0A5B2VI79_9BACT|nr:alpha/beta hydrolase [Chitinophaga agrisoli]KAA2238634.1 alpha/beta hydrolase [Chitinophaga agrisoli]